jgi:DNA-binding transcriptional MerR regulator
MSKYTVRQVSAFAGVSVRTLHVYDELGLLKPADRTESRYRLYGDKELLRLQQILFYKELDFSLEEIGRILDSPDFDIVQALSQHKTALATKRDRLDTLLATIDNTINHIIYTTNEGDFCMKPEELYEGLPKEFATIYRDEAHKNWGDAVKNSEEALRKMSKADFAKLNNDFKENWKMLSTMTAQDPSSDAVQERIVRHYALTRALWGTSALPDNQAAQFLGLGELYIEDTRFTEVDGVQVPGFGAFMSKAMNYFVETALAEPSVAA